VSVRPKSIGALSKGFEIATEIYRHRQSRARNNSVMAKCEVCGNDYDKSFEVIASGNRHVFDSFECAIHAVAPTCEHCGCRIVGHGVEQNGSIYCCVNCARSDGTTELKDRA
jgi:hypothetical protein